MGEKSDRAPRNRSADGVCRGLDDDGPGAQRARTAFAERDGRSEGGRDAGADSSEPVSQKRSLVPRLQRNEGRVTSAGQAAGNGCWLSCATQHSAFCLLFGSGALLREWRSSAPTSSVRPWVKWICARTKLAFGNAFSL